MTGTIGNGAKMPTITPIITGMAVPQPLITVLAASSQTVTPSMTAVIIKAMPANLRRRRNTVSLPIKAPKEINRIAIPKSYMSKVLRPLSICKCSWGREGFAHPRFLFDRNKRKLSGAPHIERVPATIFIPRMGTRRRWSKGVCGIYAPTLFI
jgi:hypothetical protein